MTERNRTGMRRSPWRLGTVVSAVLTALVGTTAIAVVASAPPASRSASFADGTPVGELEHAWTRPGGMLAIGWDIDSDAKTAPVRTNARVDGEYAAGVYANLPRPDLLATYPKSGPNHGFKFFVPVPEGEHTVCVRAKNVGKGENRTLGCVTRTFDYGPYGALESLRTTPGHLTVKGWAVDNDAPTTAVTTTIVIDGLATKLLADKYRKDLAAAHPVSGGYHGFAASLPLSQGTHKVCVKTKNIGYGSDNTFGCRTIVLNDSPRGALEYAVQKSGALKVVGWAFDGDAPTTSLTVGIKVDGTVHSAVANVVRADIAKTYPAAGQYHGYAASYVLPEGSHTVCVTAHDIGYGSNVTFPCRTVVLNFTPAAAITNLTATATGGSLRGWATDPDTTTAISVAITADGKAVKTVTADRSGTTHDGHVFALAVPLKSGTHTVCATGLNALYGTHNSKPACRSITLALRPIGAYEALSRATGSTNLVAKGWTLDPDTTSPIAVRVRLDGAAYGTATANVSRSDIGTAYPAFGPKHGISTVIKTDDGEHTVCLSAVNVGGGADYKLGCKLIIAVHPAAPSAPRNVTAIAGYGGAQVSWSAPLSDGGAPWSKYTIVSSPGGVTVTAGPTATTGTVLGLKPGTTYSFTVRATNVAGASNAGTSPSVKTQSSPPAQTTPAPVSTSRYIRNIRGASATEQATMHAEGAKDAYYNPSGHGYLVLLDIGGQDQYDGGVVLSATTRFVSYANLVTDLKAYIDGYHSKQHASAPATIAIGTNNDMDVTSASGKAWATKVVNPVRAYVGSHYAGMTVAGANDIEPGFRAGYTASKAWLGGYLANTTAPFVFNGSADGCAWTTINRGCNNGWTMSGLYYLAAGAAPIRMLNLPQVYNTTMAAQWKYISLTGVAASHPRINFGGPLTEWTACDQTNSCGSLSGHTAWSTLWNNLQSDSRLKVGSLPYSTDLRIDQ
jgi:hypothetical protein